MDPEKELTQASKELEAQIQSSRQWSLNIQAGPECVAVMAEVLVIVSRKEVMGIVLSGEGLREESLYANAKHCLAVGSNVLRDTAERMKTVHRWANEMGRREGTVDQITKYLHPDQSAARDRQFKRHLQSGQRMVSNSVQEIRIIREEFGEWRHLTACLLRALENEAMRNERREKRTNKELKEKEMEKSQFERQLKKEQEDLTKLTSKFEKALDTYETVVQNVPATISGAAALVGSLAAVGVAPPVALAGLVALGVQYSVLDARRRDYTERINRLERESIGLKGTLEELAKNAKSISEIANIVRRSINSLSDLQDKIDMFMEYLINIQGLMNLGAEAGTMVFDTTIGKEELQDMDIKKYLFEQSFQLKASFLFAAKAAKLYNDVSTQFIIPGLKWFSGLRLCVDGREGSLEASLEDITKQRRYICSGAEEVADKMSVDLDECLHSLIQETAESFRKTDPELWSGGTSSKS